MQPLAHRQQQHPHTDLAIDSPHNQHPSHVRHTTLTAASLQLLKARELYLYPSDNRDEEPLIFYDLEVRGAAGGRASRGATRACGLLFERNTHHASVRFLLSTPCRTRAYASPTRARLPSGLRSRSPPRCVCWELRGTRLAGCCSSPSGAAGTTLHPADLPSDPTAVFPAACSPARSRRCAPRARTSRRRGCRRCRAPPSPRRGRADWTC